MSIYIVAENDTVDEIATEYNVNVQKLIADNQLISPYELAIGQALFIEENTPPSSERTINVGGYAYPFINEWVLDQTLPYLSELYIFSYGFTFEGELVPPLWSDEWMIQKAINQNVKPILTLTPFDQSGNFNNLLISAIVNNPERIDRLLQELIEIMRQKKYQGVDIDFEYIMAEDRDAFSSFVQTVADRMHANSFTVSVALAPKVSEDQQGLLYQGKDYKALGAAADTVLLMTYEWGYTYGPPMAVAPIHQVRRVLEYALTEIPSWKINLGIPNYGYDWPLPYEKGFTKAQTLGNIQAVRIAIEQGVSIQFDELSQSPFFEYTDNFIKHEVWFEDIQSLNQKFSLITEYGLRGCIYWQIMQWFRANWLQLTSRFEIQKQ